MDEKFQEIMHMAYNLMFSMIITNGEMLLILRLNRSKNIKYSKIMVRLSMRRTKSEMHIRAYFVFDVKHCGKIQGKTCGRWTSHLKTK